MPPTDVDTTEGVTVLSAALRNMQATPHPAMLWDEDNGVAFDPDTEAWYWSDDRRRGWS